MKTIQVGAIHYTPPQVHDYNQTYILEKFNQAAERLDGTGMDLVVTCEGYESQGQTLDQAENAEKPGPILQMYMDFARRNHCTVAGSVKWREPHGSVTNALAFIGPAGEVLGHYGKNYLTPGEFDLGLVPGKSPVVVDTPAGRLGGVICYDLNFEALRDQYAALKPDILCFSSMFHGGHLQRGWAYQCRAFLVAALKDMESEIRDPSGRVLSAADAYTLIARTSINLDRAVCHLDGLLAQIPAIQRRYRDGVQIDVAPELCIGVIYSRCEVPATAMAEEFGVVSLDTTLRRSSEQRADFFSRQDTTWK